MNFTIFDINSSDFYELIGIRRLRATPDTFDRWIDSQKKKNNNNKAKEGSDRAGRLRRGAAVAVVVGGGFYSILRWKSSPVVAITATAALNSQFAKWHSVARGSRASARVSSRADCHARVLLISGDRPEVHITNIIDHVSERPEIGGAIIDGFWESHMQQDIDLNFFNFIGVKIYTMYI